MGRLDRFCKTLDLAVLAAGIVVITPLVTSNSTLDPALTPQFLAWAVGTSLLCLSLLVQIALRPTGSDIGILRRAIFPAYLGYVLFSVGSLTQAANVGEGVYECLKAVLSVVFLLLATSLFLRRAGSVALVIKAAVVTAILVSLIGLWQFFEYGVTDRPGYSLLNGTMGHKNLFASGLFLLLPFCLYTVLACRGFWSVLGIVPLALIPPLLFLSRSRAVWLALIVTAALAAAIALAALPRIKPAIPVQTRKRVIGKLAFIAAACLLIVALIAVPQARSHSLRDFVTAATNTDSLFERIAVWQKTAEMVRDNATWGVGAGNWKIAFPSYGLLDDAPTDWLSTIFFIRPHNDFLWVWSEIGTAGFLFYAATFAISLFYALRIIRKRPWTSDTLLAVLMFLGLIGYVIIACFSFSKERAFDTLFLLLMMAVVATFYHQHFPTRPAHSRSLMMGVLVVSQLLLLFTIAVGYLRLNAEVYTKRALAARNAQDWSAVTREIDVAYSPFASLDPMATPLKWYRGEADFTSGNLPQATLDYEQALAAHPHHIHALNNLATCYTLANRPADAIRLYEEALRIFPRFAEAACNLAAIHFNKGDYAKAQQVLTQSDPNTHNATLDRYRRIVAAKLATNSHPASKNSASTPPFADKLKDVHRLWSSSFGRYFYTINANERDAYLHRQPQGWTDEGIAYRAFADNAVPGLAPVYRFYSPSLKGYVYTISPQEAQSLKQEHADQWQHEGTAFYAFPEGRQPQDAAPVHRFWSPSLQYHIYTIDDREATQLRTLHSQTWTCEGIAWYAYPALNFPEEAESISPQRHGD